MKIDLRDGIYSGLWSGYQIKLDNGYEVTTEVGVKGINIPVKIKVTSGNYEILREDERMSSEEARTVLQRIRQEGFHYCFENYSKWEEIGDKKFHELRKKYLESATHLYNYLSKCVTDDESGDLEFKEEVLFEGDPVVATWGYNDVTKKPFKFLYDFGYYNSEGNCIVYNHGECNMQDAHCFEKKEIRKATDEDLRKEYWGH